MRQIGNRQAKVKTFALVVDGECELWYFQMMERHEVFLGKRIRLFPEIPQKKKIKDQYDDVIKKAEYYDVVYWIVDLDVLIKEDKEKRKGKRSSLDEFKNYCKEINKKDNINVIINNPCWEFWILLHFEQVGKYYENYNLLMQKSNIKQHLPHYIKKKSFYLAHHDDIYQKLKPHQEKAIQNSRGLGEKDLNNLNKAISEMYVIFDENTGIFSK